MSTTTTAVTAAPAKKPNAFIRFIDAIGKDFKKVAPIAEEVAEAAKPFLALTPFGPEYDLVVDAIVGAQTTAAAAAAAGSTTTGTQKMAQVIAAVQGGLTTILASKGITEPAAVEQAVNEFAQNVYNLQTGPTALTQTQAVIQAGVEATQTGVAVAEGKTPPANPVPGGPIDG